MRTLDEPTCCLAAAIKFIPVYTGPMHAPHMFALYTHTHTHAQ